MDRFLRFLGRMLMSILRFLGRLARDILRDLVQAIWGPIRRLIVKYTKYVVGAGILLAILATNQGLFNAVMGTVLAIGIALAGLKMVVTATFGGGRKRR